MRGPTHLVGKKLRRGRGEVLAEAPSEVLDIPGVKEDGETLAKWTLSTNDAFVQGGIGGGVRRPGFAS